MQFVRGIGAVVLWGVFGWNRCSEPSQALRASSPGGRAKGLVGIGRQSDKSEFGDECIYALFRPVCETAPFSNITPFGDGTRDKSDELPYNLMI